MLRPKRKAKTKLAPADENPPAIHEADPISGDAQKIVEEVPAKKENIASSKKLLSLAQDISRPKTLTDIIQQLQTVFSALFYSVMRLKKLIAIFHREEPRCRLCEPKLEII